MGETAETVAPLHGYEAISETTETMRVTYSALPLTLGALASLAACGATLNTPASTPPATARIEETASPSAPASSPSPDPTATWRSFSSAEAQLAFRYPPSWKFLTCAPSTQRPLYAEMGATPLLPCNGDESPIPQVNIQVLVGDQVSEATTNTLGTFVGTPNGSSDVTVAGVIGTRITARVDTDLPLPPLRGTTQVVYSFYTSGRTYLFYSPYSRINRIRKATST